MRVYAFDVDETLEVSNGPVKLSDIMDLRRQGHIIGLCGNFAMVTMNVVNWHYLFSFIGPGPLSKPEFLRNIREMVPADQYILVGNDHLRSARPYMSPDDARLAREAGWDFISELDFKV